ncbi:PepSY domain-containing protein [Nonomuraea sp. B19D2]|uniref:PepSY domain-containing protein n=1 Tax=Nonomuraea sp. B19D2 TaxID=3159561 RepID=UPI0032DB609A
MDHPAPPQPAPPPRPRPRRVRAAPHTVWHGSLGLWAVLGLLFLSATGLTWSKYAGENVDELRAALNWTTPSLNLSGGDHAGHTASGGHHAGVADVGVDRVAQAAAGKGLSGPLKIVWPAGPGEPYLVRRSTRPRPPAWTRSRSIPPPAR